MNPSTAPPLQPPAPANPHPIRRTTGVRPIFAVMPLLLFLISLPSPLAPPNIPSPVLVKSVPALSTATDTAALFPLPGIVAQQESFWLKVFSAYSSEQVLIHDNWYLNVVYEVVDLREAGGMPWKEVEDLKSVYEATLADMEELWDTPEKMTPEQRRIHDLFTPWAESPRFPWREAASRVRVQPGQADSIRKGIVWSGRYADIIPPILKREGVPPELGCLPLIESAFNPFARSPVGATGLWQLMRRAAAHQGLQVTPLVDERRDPILSTEAAGRHLAHNYEILGSWPLAITAYNAGLQRMVTATREVGSTDLGDIVAAYDHPRFDFASRNFYAEFMAAMRVFQHPVTFLGPVEKEPALTIASLPLPVAVRFPDLAQWTELTPQLTRKLNPALLPEAYSPRHFLPKGIFLNVPCEEAERLAPIIASLPDTGADAVAVAGPGHHRVAPGETLSRIAQRYGVTVMDLRLVNQIEDAGKIVTGRKLRLPSLAGKTAPSRRNEPVSTPKEPKDLDEPDEPDENDGETGKDLPEEGVEEISEEKEEEMAEPSGRERVTLSVPSHEPGKPSPGPALSGQPDLVRTTTSPGSLPNGEPDIRASEPAPIPEG